MVLLVGNLLDGLFTLALLQLQLAREANPVMRWLYESSPVFFMVAKLSAVQLAALLLWLHRGVPAARWALGVGATLYGGVVGYHLSLVAAIGLLPH